MRVTVSFRDGSDRPLIVRLGAVMCFLWAFEFSRDFADAMTSGRWAEAAFHALASGGAIWTGINVWRAA